MEVIIAIATMPGRDKFLANTIKSLAGQCDQLRIYDNGKRNIDLTDNGKFYFLKEYKEPVYYLTCDDDIIYPVTYVHDMVKAIDRTKGIVTHHGRILTGPIKSYYRGRHKTFRCNGWVNKEKQIHVGGSGVMGWRTDMFNPVDIYASENKRMSDLVIALEASKQGVKITVLAHPVNYVIVQPVPNEETIFGQERNGDIIQTQIACEVLKTLTNSPN